MKSVFIDVQSHQVKVVDIEDKLEVFYRMIGCNLVEIPRRYIGKKLYSVICDEEATFVEDPIPSMIDEEVRSYFWETLSCAAMPMTKGI